MPDWFFRKVWRRKQGRAADRRPASAATLFLAGETAASQTVGAGLQRDGTRCIRVERGGTFAVVVDGRYRLAPAELDGYRRLLQMLREQDCFPDRIVHCWNHGPAADEDGGPRGDHSLGICGLDLLALVRR